MKHLLGFTLILLMFTACNTTTSSSSEPVEKPKQVEATAKTSAPIEISPDLKGIERLSAIIEQSSELKVSRIEPTPISGLFAVFLSSGDIIYSNEEGTHFVAGDLYHILPDVKGMENLTESQREKERAKIFSDIKTKDMVVFPPKSSSKAHIYVFTDVDCYYCQKLHKEVPALNAAGVEVRYLAFPRAGLQSASYQKIQSAWCAKDRQDAMNKLKARQNIPNNDCGDTAVAQQYNLGAQLGVRGTPSIYTADGVKISGYMPAKQLIEMLGL